MSSFETCRAKAVQLFQRQRLLDIVLQLAFIAAVLFGGGGLMLWPVLTGAKPSPAAIGAIALWFAMLLIGLESRKRAFSKLRAALQSRSPLTRFTTPPGLWVPSPSHGLVIVDDELLFGKEVASFDRHDPAALVTAAYDERRHLLLLANGTERFEVKLDASVSREQGFDLARLALERCR